MKIVRSGLAVLAEVGAHISHNVPKSAGLAGAGLVCWIVSGCSDALAPAPRALAIPQVMRNAQALPVSSMILEFPAGTTHLIASYPFVEQVLAEGRTNSHP